MLGKWIFIHNKQNDLPELDDFKIAIIGVCEDRGAILNSGSATAPNEVRRFLYRLSNAEFPKKIADLGNIKAGNTIEDTYFAISEVVAELLKHNILPIIIGGSNDIAFANYLAYKKIEQTINIVAIDSRFDFGEADGPINSQTYLSQIILNQPNFLFNYSNVAYQSYFVSKIELELIEKLYFDAHRLGVVRSNIAEIEPVLRNADMISFDISSVRQADAAAAEHASPNGLYGEEACQIMRYAGMSDKLTSIGIYEINPSFDFRNQTSHLAAQMIWYLFDGYFARKGDYPVADKSDYTKFRVMLKNNKYELIFYKSNKSDRWWMDVPYPPDKTLKYERHHFVPCTYSDYLTACNDEMPDRWWNTYQKLM
ncbi:MAG: formimidoylglutamase [Bacteroidia bacterium]